MERLIQEAKRLRRELRELAAAADRLRARIEAGKT